MYIPMLLKIDRKFDRVQNPENVCHARLERVISKLQVFGNYVFCETPTVIDIAYLISWS